MKYCSACVTPNTRPHLTLDADGVCNACEAARQKGGDIDWDSRASSFSDVARSAVEQGREYDCLIPVSGGKDSTWQVVTCLEAGLHPLAVTWKTPARTELGARNLANLVSLGVDHIDFQVNPKVEAQFMLKALDRFGSTAIPMHMSLFNVPLKLAARYEIPLVVWGENSAFEYGGTEEERTGSVMDSTWLRKYGITQGTTAEDWIDAELTRADLSPYFGPTPEELQAKGTRAVFLGYYYPWDPETSLRVARQHGFESRVEGPKLGLYDYADIDCDFISIHHWIKWYKFGFTRLFDNLSLEIRAGRSTREQAIEVICETGEQRPSADIRAFCSFVGISEQSFDERIEPFRNPQIWKRGGGVWKIPGFLVPDWKWS